MANETIITIVGNLADAPELRFTASGAPVASFRVLSTPRTFDKQANEWRDGETLAMNCSAWRQLAENVAESLTKGSRVVVQGRLQQRSYEKDGEKRTVVEMQADEVGASLTTATAVLTRTTKQPRQQPQGGASQPGSHPGGPTDPWATGGAQTGAQGTDEPPF